MTVKSVDLQVLVPRAGEVERINRTVQGQQQTDQQIMGQAIRGDLKQQTRIVSQTRASEQKKVEKDGREKQKKNEQQKDEAEDASSSITGEQNENENKGKYNLKKGRYLDIRI